MDSCIAMVEGEVTLVVQGASVVERGAIIEFVKGDNVVHALG